MSEKENEEQGVEIASETMLGDLTKTIVDELKVMPDVWQKLSQSKQDGVIERVEKRVREAVRVCVELIASNGRSTIPATLEQVTVKDGIKGVVTVQKGDPKRHELTDAVGRNVLIVVADPREHFGGSGSVKGDPDQRELPIEEGGDVQEPEAQDPDNGGEFEAIESGGEAPPIIASELETNELEANAAAEHAGFGIVPMGGGEGSNGGGDDEGEMKADQVVAGLKERGYVMKKHKVVALEDADYWAVVDYLRDRGPAPVFLAEYAVATAED